MSKRLRIWGVIRYLSFLGLFASLIAAYWAYSFKSTSNIGEAQAATHPYQNYTLMLVLLCILLSAIFVYSGILAKKGKLLPQQAKPTACLEIRLSKVHCSI